MNWAKKSAIRSDKSRFTLTSSPKGAKTYLQYVNTVLLKRMISRNICHEVRDAFDNPYCIGVAVHMQGIANPNPHIVLETVYSECEFETLGQSALEVKHGTLLALEEQWGIDTAAPKSIHRDTTLAQAIETTDYSDPIEALFLDSRVEHAKMRAERELQEARTERECAQLEFERQHAQLKDLRMQLDKGNLSLLYGRNTFEILTLTGEWDRLSMTTPTGIILPPLIA